MAYDIDYSEEKDGLTVNKLRFDYAIFNFDELIEDKRDASDFVVDLLNATDPDKKIPEDILPALAGILYTLVNSLWNIEDRLGKVEKFAANHRHVEKTIGVVEES